MKNWTWIIIIKDHFVQFSLWFHEQFSIWLRRFSSQFYFIFPTHKLLLWNFNKSCLFLDKRTLRCCWWENQNFYICIYVLNGFDEVTTTKINVSSLIFFYGQMNEKKKPVWHVFLSLVHVSPFSLARIILTFWFMGHLRKVLFEWWWLHFTRLLAIMHKYYKI